MHYAGSPTNTPTPTYRPTSTPTNTPTNTTVSFPEDINGDMVINMADVILLAAHFNTVSTDSNYDKKCDLNNDGAISMADVIILAKKFNTKCVPSPTPAGRLYIKLKMQKFLLEFWKL
jgi:heme-binding NEAT domain protein